MSKRNSSVCKWKANEKCVTVLHPLQCISIPHRGHPEDTREKKKKEINTTSISHSILWLSDCSNRKTSARQEVTCTYLHHTTPLFFLSPTLLSFQRQATHGPDRTHEAAAEHCHLPDGGQQKPAAWVHWQPCWRATLTLPEHGSTYCAGHLFKTYTCSATKGNFEFSWAFQTEQGSNFTSVHLGVCTFTKTLPVECLPLHLHTAVSGISV